MKIFTKLRFPHPDSRIFLLLLFFPLTLFARDITITVEDADLGIPLEGAVIRYVGTAYVADGEGKAVITVPDNQQVMLQIAYPGYENGRLAVPVSGNSFIVSLRIGVGGILENKELVIEAQQPGTNESKTGRSVAIADEDLARTAEIGIIEDVMTSIKLLPGVGYTGMFNAMPSIRGGEPGDLTAVFDGFYISNPYHWGGGVSIFDPRMVQSARLSHGVFSTRYGHTISGLLEITSHKPEPHDVEIELGLSTSAANLNISYPLMGKGGVMIMGKVTYWDPFVSFMKLFIDEVNYIKVAPYIRSSAFSVNYRFTPNLEWTMAGFIGGDGAGAYYDNEELVSSVSDMDFNKTTFDFNWDNLQGFLITGLNFNPKPTMILKATIGAGFLRTKLKGDINYGLTVPYSDDFIRDFGPLLNGKTSYIIDETMFANMTDTIVNFQGRADFDWDLGKGFLFAVGLQELYAKEMTEEHDQGTIETSAPTGFPLIPPSYDYPWYINFPGAFGSSVANHTLTSSAYTLVEYASPQKRLGAELGLRLDHLYFIGRDFTIQTKPALNPRLNFDWTILQDKGIFDSIAATIGTGLFSSTTDNISSIQSEDGIDDFELTQNRSWTSIIGFKFDVTGGYSLNIEGYYKYVFDRAYSRLESNPANQSITIDRNFDGEGRVWGFDLMLQKTDSRYWSGWVSYSFTWAKYRNPALDNYQADWYFPSFHRFHNLNLVLNIKPVKFFNIAIRLGIASGAPKSVVTGDITSYPVIVLDKDGMPIQFIQKYKRSTAYSATERDGFTIPLDLKFSFFRANRSGRGQMEFYVAVENLLAYLKTRQRNTSFNSYTGKEDEGSTTASYQLPIPMPSIGFKWSY